MHRTAIVVLGMHRSGTSSVAGMLSKIGCEPPRTLLPDATDNPSGFWESQVICELNDAFLGEIGSLWWDWNRLCPLSIDEAILRRYDEDVREALLREYSGSTSIVLKDPRICRTAAIWDRALISIGYDPRYVIPLRSPFEVAASLQQRNGLPVAESLKVWLRHVLDAERATRGKPRVFLDWSSFILDWRGAAARISDGLSWPVSDEIFADGSAVDAFIDAGLRHHVIAIDCQTSAVSRLALLVFDLFRQMIEQDAADDIATDFDRLHQEFETAIAAA